MATERYFSMLSSSSRLISPSVACPSPCRLATSSSSSSGRVTCAECKHTVDADKQPMLLKKGSTTRLSVFCLVSHQSVCLSVHLSVYQSVCLHLFVSSSVHLSVCHSNLSPDCSAVISVGFEVCVLFYS